MPRHTPVRLLSTALLALVLAACAGLSNRDPLNVQLAGIEPLPGEGLELRFALRLRVQNPNDIALDYEGLALDLDVMGRRLASGVSDQRGTLPRYGEAVLHVPVTVSAFSAARQMLGLADGRLDAVPFVLRGKLSGGLLGTQRFLEQGTLDLSGRAWLR